VVSIEVFRDLNVGLPKEDNAFWDIINARSAFVINPNTPIQSTGLQIVTFNRNVIFRRKIGIEQLITEDIDGDTVVSIPWDSADIYITEYTETSLALFLIRKMLLWHSLTKVTLQILFVISQSRICNLFFVDSFLVVRLF